jgi:hypothetical protein
LNYGGSPLYQGVSIPSSLPFISSLALLPLEVVVHRFPSAAAEIARLMRRPTLRTKSQSTGFGKIHYAIRQDPQYKWRGI